MKKILCFVTSLAMCGLFAVNVNAAEGITADEQAILNELKAGVEVDGKTVSVPAEYINQAESFLKTNDVTAEQAKTINAEIAAAKEIVKTNKITDVKEIKGSVASEIFARAKSAAATVGVTLEVGADKTITVKDKAGNALFVVSNGVIKATGDNYSMMFGMTGAIALILVGAGVVAGKKGYFAK